MQYNRIKVGNGKNNVKGAVNAFCISNGIIYGLSAAHVLLGKNRIEDLTDLVHIWDDDLLEWVFCSEPVKIAFEKGGYSSSEYGRIDAGIFILSDDLQAIFSQRKFLRSIIPSKFLNYPKELRNDERYLYAYSVQLDKHITGEIIKVQEKQKFREEGTNIYREYHCDVVIQIKSGQETVKGDSGLIWYDKDDNAFAMHIAGFWLKDTKYSIATFIHRVLSCFQNTATDWFEVNPDFGIDV